VLVRHDTVFSGDPLICWVVYHDTPRFVSRVARYDRVPIVSVEQGADGINKIGASLVFIGG
jgi:hypothetical protein